MTGWLIIAFGLAAIGLTVGVHWVVCCCTKVCCLCEDIQDDVRCCVSNESKIRVSWAFSVTNESGEGCKSGGDCCHAHLAAVKAQTDLEIPFHSARQNQSLTACGECGTEAISGFIWRTYQTQSELANTAECTIGANNNQCFHEATNCGDDFFAAFATVYYHARVVLVCNSTGTLGWRWFVDAIQDFGDSIDACDSIPEDPFTFKRIVNYNAPIGAGHDLDNYDCCGWELPATESDYCHDNADHFHVHDEGGAAGPGPCGAGTGSCMVDDGGDQCEWELTTLVIELIDNKCCVNADDECNDAFGICEAENNCPSTFTVDISDCDAAVNGQTTLTLTEGVNGCSYTWEGTASGGATITLSLSGGTWTISDDTTACTYTKDSDGTACPPTGDYSGATGTASLS